MNQAEFPSVEGTITATADNQVLPLSSVDLFAIWLNTNAIIVSADGVVTVGPSSTAPVSLPLMFPPIPPLAPGVGFRPNYNLKNIYAKFTKAGDSLTFLAYLPIP